MQLKNQVEWALHCCAILSGLPEGRYLSTKDLAEFHGVPKEYLSKALQSLSQAALVVSTLGPSGGYRLAKPLDKLTFLDIVEAVEGAKSTFECTNIRLNNPCLAEDAPPAAYAARPCAIARVMWEADKAYRDKLQSVSLADLQKTLERDVPPKLWKKTAAWFAARI